MTCCVTGHRPKGFPFNYDEDSHEYIMYLWRLHAEIEKLLRMGCKNYICGMANGVDLDFAEGILFYRDSDENITLEAALPYPIISSKRPNRSADKREFLLRNCNEITVVSQFYHAGCMENRNRYMVDKSEIVLAVWNGQQKGGTWNTIQYAKSMKKDIVYIMLQDIL